MIHITNKSSHLKPISRSDPSLTLDFEINSSNKIAQRSRSSSSIIFSASPPANLTTQQILLFIIKEHKNPKAAKENLIPLESSVRCVNAELMLLTIHMEYKNCSQPSCDLLYNLPLEISLLQQRHLLERSPWRLVALLSIWLFVCAESFATRVDFHWYVDDAAGGNQTHARDRFRRDLKGNL